MKIGIDARPLSISQAAGIANYLIELIKRLPSLLPGSEFYLYSNKPIPEKYCTDENIHCCYMPSRIGTFWLRYKLPYQLKKDGIDVFWGPNQLLPGKVKGIKFILTVHDVNLLINRKWGSTFNYILHKLYMKDSLNSADVVIVDSDSTGSDLIRLYGISGEKIKTVYLGSNFNTTNDTEDLSEHGINKPFILSLGSVNERKNVGTAVKAFDMVASERPDLMFVIAGEVNKYSHNTLEIIDKSPYKNRINVMGYIDKKTRNTLLKEAEAFIFISHYEGFGLPILEAMDAGTVVISAVNSSLKEVGGDAALYADDENDAVAVSEQIKKVLSMTETEKQSILEKGYHQVKQFSWDKCAERTVQLILSQ